MKDYLKMTALEIGEGIKNKEFTSPEVTGAFLENISGRDTLINAYITVCKEAALERAVEVQKLIDDGKLDSPLAGVPIALKDNICTKGVRTTCASGMLHDFVPPYSATVAERLENAGAVIIGKLNMDEFAMGSTSETSFFGAVKNPWEPTRVPGGSSGGAAAAIAAGEAVCALGSDTGGSIRQPAAYCGITGFKPSYGAVSRYGLIAYASSFDQIGPMAKDTADCAAIMDIIAGRDERDSTSLRLSDDLYSEKIAGSIKGMKIALPEECFGEGVACDIRENVLAASEVLRGMGAVIEKISLPFMEYVVPAYYIMASAEAPSNLSRFDGVKYGFRAAGYDGLSDMYEKTRSEGFGFEVKKRILLGTFVLSSGYYDAYYKKSMQVRALIKRGFDDIFSKYDLIMTPTAPVTAPLLSESLKDPLKMYLSDIFTVSANMAGLPALSLPCGLDRNGLPTGAQLMGAHMSDTMVLRAGCAYQTVTDYHRHLPPKVR